MKKILFLILIFVTLGFANRDTVLENRSYKIGPGSHLSVIGTSNVRGFTCKYDITKFDNAIPVHYNVDGDKMLFSKSDLILENINFNCGGRGINRDFNEVLKTDLHPEIKLSLKEILNFNKKKQVEVLVDISLAGVTNHYRIPVAYKVSNKLEVSGQLDLALDDFNIIAPTKLFGLVQLGNHVEIEFQLFLESI
ncbi:YceI family protein [Pseudotamlana agarivorans]|uniref:YceI family protein n=1 Tax=Pseudotamlana agarivorans TaxID=481183 RepID=UPI00083172E0|nr:YceI family protein [Tamlana agarivorans]